MSTYESLLERDNSVTIHDLNLQLLATEMYKLKNGLTPKIMEDLFPCREIKYNGCNVKSSNVNTVYYGKETLSFRVPKTWSLLSAEIQNSPSLKIFKGKIKIWKPIGCACRISTPFIPGVGFI